MAGSNYLLDTNVIAALLNKDPTIETLIKDRLVGLPSIALGELYFGAYKSSRVDDNLHRIVRLATRFPLFVCDQMTADYYGQIKLTLRKKGRPIPENDIWIAATAMQHGLTLATRDAHFDEVDGLAHEKW